MTHVSFLIIVLLLATFAIAATLTCDHNKIAVASQQHSQRSACNKCSAVDTATTKRQNCSSDESKSDENYSDDFATKKRCCGCCCPCCCCPCCCCPCCCCDCCDCCDCCCGCGDCGGGDDGLNGLGNFPLVAPSPVAGGTAANNGGAARKDSGDSTGDGDAFKYGNGENRTEIMEKLENLETLIKSASEAANYHFSQAKDHGFNRPKPVSSSTPQTPSSR